MDHFIRDLERYVQSGNFINSNSYLKKYSREDYLTLFEVLKDWIFDGLEQHLPNEDMNRDAHMLASSSLVYCSWIITHVLKKGVNDHSYNSKKLKYIFSRTELDSKVDLILMEEFLISGMGMAISQCSEVLSVPNSEVCHMVVSLNLMMTEHMMNHSGEQYVA